MLAQNASERNSHRTRQDFVAQLVAACDFAYAPMFYEPEYHADGTIAAMNRTRADVPKQVFACTIQQDFDAIPLPTKPVVPFIQTPHDRIAIEIMRGCPHQCRFCQSTVIKRPLRLRSVETIVQAALESYRNTGTNEISLLSLSTSDYPHFEELVKRMQEVFHPLGVNVSLPSLRINHQLRTLPALMQGARKAGLKEAPTWMSWRPGTSRRTRAKTSRRTSSRLRGAALPTWSRYRRSGGGAGVSEGVNSGATP
jgi:hypothetical protein